MPSDDNFTKEPTDKQSKLLEMFNLSNTEDFNSDDPLKYY